MSINVKKYTKDQMAKMVEEAQAEVQELKRVNAAMTEQISQMNAEAINKANEIEKLKADLDSAKNSAQHLNDQGQQYWRAWQASKREVADLKNKLADTDAALGRASDECAFKQEVINVMRNRRYNAEQRANYAEAHPWRNLWAWVKRKLKMA
jgi:chromosome segregation ATPase|nr:MAG TPA: Macoilin family [Caudoviricetes sp.]